MNNHENYIWPKAILDADFALKMEKVKKINAIEEYIPQLVGHLYIHRYVYENEILVPYRVKEQLQKLIGKGVASIVDAETLKQANPLNAHLYQQTINLLTGQNSKTKVNGKNWGETVSSAYAHISSIPFILSDEIDLQQLLDSNINGVDRDITVIRLRDFILGMKEKNLSRKDAYAIWLFAKQDKKDRSKLERAKVTFQEDLWPLSKSAKKV
ncbi:hypothetical protein [Priestia megaterium]|uniref:hypothetical protein n=1 Tax=Priestia megaterium TaxID=1404 RepID=UPI00301BA3A7